MPESKLTDVAVRKIGIPGMYADGAGLFLCVTDRKRGGLAKSWTVRYTAPDGRRREMGLGAYPEISLADARRRAKATREQARDGRDPLDERARLREEAVKARAEAVTFRRAAEAYIDANKAGWRNAKHAAQWTSSLEAYVYPYFGSTLIRDLEKPTIIRALERIWTSKPETARRVRGRVRLILQRCIDRGERDEPNPAAFHHKAMPTVPLEKRKQHHPALPFDQVSAFLADLRSGEGAGARALEFAILTAARTGEVIGAQWGEINLEKAVWTVPADRMKAAREHRVPLSSPAVKLLRDLIEASPAGRRRPFVFATADGAPLSNMAMLMTLRRMNRRDITVHGFRSTFRDWTAEATNFQREVAEAALAHVIGDGTERAYARGDLFEKRRKLMEAWGAYCSKAPTSAAGGAIVAFKRKDRA